RRIGLLLTIDLTLRVDLRRAARHARVRAGRHAFGGRRDALRLLRVAALLFTALVTVVLRAARAGALIARAREDVPVRVAIRDAEVHTARALFGRRHRRTVVDA